MAITIYPQLVGLDYKVTRRPIFNNSIQGAGSGVEYSLGYWSTNLWEYVLNYSYLPDAQLNGSTASDMKTMLGFFLSVQGDFLGFLLEDPDDETVVGERIGTGDGTSTIFSFTRQYGLGTNKGHTEAVGQLNLGKTLNIYLNGVLQGSGYTVSTATPKAQLITFSSAPSATVAITADFSYYFYVRFKDPTYDFTKFANQIWNLQQITLRSLRQES